jgi:hypothetical protein
MRRIIVLLTLKLIIFSYVNVWAWNDEYTHQDLSVKATEFSILSPTNGDYLKNLGFDKNLKETFTLNGESKNVRDWVKYGSLKEDAGNVFTAYYYHHFHDPLALSWNQAGLSTWYPWINGMSSILWAQNTFNLWNWQKARDYYYLALTSSTNTQRNENFAKTFKGLGHIIHLIQDVAQPAHVRNDPHPLDDKGIVPQFENWAKSHDVSSFISNPVFPSVSLNTSVGGYIPITQLWDTNQYTGSNPPFGTNIGLSEYTNANFFSEDTINASNFPYPDITKTTVTEKTAPSGIYQRQYYLKNCCGETKGSQGYLLAAVDYLDYYRQQYPSLSFALPRIPVLDNNVYSDYASLLLPRAVGYSAGLLNYFFRGKINMVPDQNSPGQYVIKNESNEYMSGLFSLYYEDTGDNRHHVASWSLSINPNSSSSTVTFTPPTYPEPKQKGTYILAFQGRLGNESGAVVGRAGIPLCQSNISISGPDEAVDGTQYTATGGTEPYTWSINNGSITQDGVVSFSGQCGGIATITVTDSCGAKKEKTVTIPITVIVVSGPDTPTDGAQYTASGGKSPYTWTISKGSITQDGIVTVSGQCGTITVTATDKNGCKGAKVMDMQAEITLSGPDAPVDGDQYTATGGTEPYTWSISKGSITQDGVVTVSGQCGVATITATDACGNIASKGVRMPSGAWVQISTEVNPSQHCSYNWGQGGYYTCEIIEGQIKAVYGIACFWDFLPQECEQAPPCGANYCGGGFVYNWYVTYTFEWRCQ